MPERRIVPMGDFTGRRSSRVLMVGSTKWRMSGAMPRNTCFLPVVPFCNGECWTTLAKDQPQGVHVDSPTCHPERCRQSLWRSSQHHLPRAEKLAFHPAADAAAGAGGG